MKPATQALITGLRAQREHWRHLSRAEQAHIYRYQREEAGLGRRLRTSLVREGRDAA